MHNTRASQRPLGTRLYVNMENSSLSRSTSPALLIFLGTCYPGTKLYPRSAVRSAPGACQGPRPYRGRWVERTESIVNGTAWQVKEKGDKRQALRRLRRRRGRLRRLCQSCRAQPSKRMLREFLRFDSSGFSDLRTVGYNPLHAEYLRERVATVWS